MINTNILNLLKSNNIDPSYSVLITHFDQPTFCNKEKLNIVVQQINPSLHDIITNKNNRIDQLKSVLTQNNIPIPTYNDISISSIVERTFEIESTLNYDQSTKMFTSGLNGSISNITNIDTPSQSITSNVKYKRISITNQDSPRLLDENKIIVRNEEIIVDINQDIRDVKATLSHNDIHMAYNDEHIIIPFHQVTYDNNNINEYKLHIDMDKVRNMLKQSTVITNIQTSIQAKNEEISELEESVDDETTQEEIDAITAQKEELNNQITSLTNKLDAIIQKINSLNFSSNTVFTLNIDYTLQDDISSNGIESIGFELQSQIDIDFFYKYQTIPNVVVTIDKKNKMYSSYDTIFKQNENDEYIGVTIKFNNLKKIKQPIEIKAIIIGDKVV